jgi:pre-mRNA-splicing factor 38B
VQEIDVKAGGGHIMTIGEMLRQWLVKLEWYSTLFPRIPVPIEKDLAIKLKAHPPAQWAQPQEPEPEPQHIPDNQVSFGEAARQGGR